MAIKTTPAYKLALQLAFEAEKDISRFKRLFDEVTDKKLLSHSIIMAGINIYEQPYRVFVERVHQRKSFALP